MGRHERRKSVAQFRHDAARADVLTYLIDADDAVLVNEPWLLKAVLNWRGNVVSHKLKCISCRALFSTDSVSPGGFLFAKPNGVSAVSVSAFCSRCWNSLDDAALEQIAARTLQAIKPGARFAP